MCRLGDLIDNRPLLELIQSINSGDNPEFTTLLQKSLSPLVADSKFVSFTGWNMAGTIYSRATAIEVTDGWKFLVNENLPLDIYTKAFYVNSLYTWLGHSTKENIQANEETDISNILEPETLELLRLCYWINRCKQIITDKKSFENKFIEIKNSLSFQNQIELKVQTNRKLVIFGKIMKDVKIPLWERELHANELVSELEAFRSNGDDC